MKKIIYIYLCLMLCTASVLEAQSNRLNNSKTSERTIHTSKSKMDQSVNVLTKNVKSSQAVLDDDEKVVFFTHGLGGEKTTWSTPRDWTYDNYKCQTPSFDYKDAQTVSEAESTVRNILRANNDDQKLHNPNYDPTTSIYIAHSLGGVVGLQMNYDEEEHGKEPQFGAMATFGSPLQGAKIAVNLDCFQEMLNEACKLLGSEIFRDQLKSIVDQQVQKVDIIPFIKNIINDKLADFIDFKISVPDGLCDLVVPIGFSFMTGNVGGGPIRYDLDPDGNTISTLKQHEITIPTVTFWGTEEDPISLREIYSLGHNVNRPTIDTDNPNPPSSDYFTADYDAGYVDQLEDLIDVFESKAQEKREEEDCSTTSRYIAYGVFGFGGLFGQEYFFCSPKRKKRLARIETLEGIVRWLQDFDNRYLICAGHKEYITKNSPVCKCKLRNPSGKIIERSTYGLCTGNEAKEYPGYELIDCHANLDDVKTVEEFVSHQGDGVVTAESAKSIKVKPGVYFQDQEMPLSNHQQMRNDKNAGVEFNKLYKGFYHDNFTLTKR